MLVKAAGQTHRIGVVEYTDDWSPFQPLPFDKTVSHDEDDDMDDDTEAIFDTWANMEEEEPEEGEIRNDDKELNVGAQFLR